MHYIGREEAKLTYLSEHVKGYLIKWPASIYDAVSKQTPYLTLALSVCRRLYIKVDVIDINCKQRSFLLLHFYDDTRD